MEKSQEDAGQLNLRFKPLEYGKDKNAARVTGVMAFSNWVWLTAKPHPWSKDSPRLQAQG